MSKKDKNAPIITSDIIIDVFKGIRPGWRKILLGPKFKPIILECFRDLDSYLREKGVTDDLVVTNGLSKYIRPNEKNIFRAFKYFDPNNLRCIIVGQDPYPSASQASGLCFSTPKMTRVSPSLKKVYECLLAHDLIQEIPTHGDLKNWAKQGCLMLNTFLTRSPCIEGSPGNVYIKSDGGKESIHRFWSKFTGELMNFLTGEFLRNCINHREHEILVLLWGLDAQALGNSVASQIDMPPGKTVRVLKWGHPSSQNMVNHNESDPKNFLHCDHFTQVSWMNWNPNYDPDFILNDQFYLARKDPEFKFEYQPTMYNDGTDTVENTFIKKKIAARHENISNNLNPIVVAIDGGCTANGKENARASYGIHFPATFNGTINAIEESNYYGIVPASELCINGEADDIYASENPINPSNNRGELMAMIHAVKIILKHIKNVGHHPVIVITDSEYVLHAVNERIWKRYKESSEFSGVAANRDLIKVLHYYLNQLATFVPNVVGGGKVQTKPWHILMQPAARNYYQDKTPMDLSWHGLTMVHQRSHIDEIPPEGTTEYDLWRCNEAADALCSEVLQLELEKSIDPLKKAD